MVAIVAATLTAYVFATKAWQLCLNLPKDSQVSLMRLFVIRQIGEALTIINPTNIVAGELSKVYMLEKDGVSKEQGSVSIVVSRGLIILSYFLILIVTSIYYLVGVADAAMSGWLILFIILAVGLFGFLFYAITSRRLVLYHFMARFLNIMRLESRLKKTLVSLESLNQSMHDFYKSRTSDFNMAFLLSLAHWLCGTLEFYFILNAFGLDITYMDAMILESGVMIFKSLGGFVPGQIGVEEYGNKIMLGLLAIPSIEVWAAVSILRRARQLFWIGLSLLFLGLFFKSHKWKYSL